MKNIIDQFELMVNNFPDKILFSDVETSITASQFKQRCEEVAQDILHVTGGTIQNSPIAVVDNRNVNTLIFMFGVVYSGNHYVLLDGASPAERLNKICGVIETKLILCEEKTEKLASELASNLDDCKVLCADKFLSSKVDRSVLSKIREKSISTDPVYILFTSGSTGVPKGTVINHSNLLSYVKWYTQTFEIDENTILANQTPFYFSASVSDVYSSFLYGATLNIIPKSYFSFPIQLTRFLNERKVNTIYWVPSALCLCANIKLLDYEKPKYLKKVHFAGEVMPNKQLNYWRNALPDVKYVNLFGPTETTDICLYYVVDREFRDDESLPIGRHCDNLDVFVIDENGKMVEEVGKSGELYVRGSFISPGYYKNEEQTKKAFVQNPLNSNYPETVYRTGDIVMLNKYGEYEYVGRKDFQIKHKGYRIELGEIERVASALDNVSTVVALYDKGEDKLIVVYSGKDNKEKVYNDLSSRLPGYMLPEVIIKLNSIPTNQNGKIDRVYLISNYKNLDKGV